MTFSLRRTSPSVDNLNSLHAQFAEVSPSFLTSERKQAKIFIPIPAADDDADMTEPDQQTTDPSPTPSSPSPHRMDLITPSPTPTVEDERRTKLIGDLASHLGIETSQLDPLNKVELEGLQNIEMMYNDYAVIWKTLGSEVEYNIEKDSGEEVSADLKSLQRRYERIILSLSRQPHVQALIPLIDRIRIKSNEKVEQEKSAIIQKITYFLGRNVPFEGLPFSQATKVLQLAELYQRFGAIWPRLVNFPFALFHLNAKRLRSVRNRQDQIALQKIMLEFQAVSKGLAKTKVAGLVNGVQQRTYVSAIAAKWGIRPSAVQELNGEALTQINQLFHIHADLSSLCKVHFEIPFDFSELPFTNLSHLPEASGEKLEKLQANYSLCLGKLTALIGTKQTLSFNFQAKKRAQKIVTPLDRFRNPSLIQPSSILKTSKKEISQENLRQQFKNPIYRYGELRPLWYMAELQKKFTDLCREYFEKIPPALRDVFVALDPQQIDSFLVCISQNLLLRAKLGSLPEQLGAISEEYKKQATIEAGQKGAPRELTYLKSTLTHRERRDIRHFQILNDKLHKTPDEARFLVAPFMKELAADLSEHFQLLRSRLHAFNGTSHSSAALDSTSLYFQLSLKKYIGYGKLYGDRQDLQGHLPAPALIQRAISSVSFQINDYSSYLQENEAQLAPAVTNAIRDRINAFKEVAGALLSLYREVATESEYASFKSELFPGS